MWFKDQIFLLVKLKMLTLKTHGMTGPNKITEQLYIGDSICARNKDLLKLKGITYTINCAKELAFMDTHEDNYLFLPMVDDIDYDIQLDVKRAIEFIDSIDTGKVFVHCQKGISRSSTIAIAYLMHNNKIKYDEALKIARKSRSCCCPNIGFGKQLRALEFDIA
jgi:protein-tyrosine phosphatase